MRLAPTLLFLGLSLALTACDRGNDAPPPADAPAPTATADDATTAVPDAAPTEPTAPAGDTMLAASAIATLQAAPGGTAAGTLHFAVADGGVRLYGDLSGLTPDATNAMHIHAVGDCSPPDFKSAGDHFNPAVVPHGDRSGTGLHHAGDMPNQVADAAGNAKVDQLLDGLNIGSGDAFDIVGKAVVVHEQADDYTTQPSGNAGARIACGIITIENPVPAYLGPADADPAAAPADAAPATDPDEPTASDTHGEA